jgi:hypothetical protein
MALTPSDWTIASNGAIRYIGAAHGVAGASYATVIELHRWLQDRADDASASGDDILDITYVTPSGRDTDNIINLLGTYNIDQVASEHLYDGTIKQTSGADIWDGIVNYGNEGINIQLIQNGTLVANAFWNATPSGQVLPGLNRDLVQGISHRFMIKTRTAGVDIDNKRILGITREYGKTYAEFNINATASGNNVLALVNAVDGNNGTASGTVATWTTITNVEGYQAIDINNDSINEYYFSQWNRDVYSINQLYERAKYLTRFGSASILYGMDAQIFRGITHEVTVNTPTGTMPAFGAASWATGTGQMLAVNSPTAGTKMWIQLLTGTAPAALAVITVGAATLKTVSVVERTALLKQPFIGTSTGSALSGAYGIGVEKTDLAAADKVFDLTNTQYSSPDYRVTTVAGLINTEDRVLVGPDNAGTLQNGQFQLNAGITSGAATIVLKVGTETPGTGTQSATDTPATGTIRVQDNNGVYQRVTYTGFSVAASTMTFTGCSGAPTAAASNKVFISYIDNIASGTSITFATIYNGARTLFARVRDGGVTPIKTFENTVALGGSISAIRTPDL